MGFWKKIEKPRGGQIDPSLGIYRVKTNKVSIKYELKDVKLKFNPVKIYNNICIFSKMAAKMAAVNLSLINLGSDIRYTIVD